MKNYLFLIGIAGLFFTSCVKKQYCASCYESISGYQAVDFCNESESVDTYIDELYSVSTQDWYCTKNAE